MNGYRSVFAEHLASYVQLRRQLGLRFNHQEALLHAFDRYVSKRDYQGPLSEQLACDFALSVPGTSVTVPARRYLVVRHFAEYLAAYDPSTPRLDPKAIYRSHHRPPPYIFTEQELEQLSRQATEVPQRHPVANLALHTMIGLAASTGLRLGEVVGLDEADVDLQSGVLVIRRTKFDKDRLVPVHATTLEALGAYSAARVGMSATFNETAFFLNTRARRYQPHNVCYLFRQLVRRIDLRPPHGRRPTFHSLRHTFAVRRLISWYREGANVQALLPALAIYMGHVHYTSTAYYLTATAEMLGVAAERLVAEEVGHGQAS